MDDLEPGEIFASRIRNQIQSAAKEGYVLVFVDDNFTQNSWQYKEIQTAMYYKSRIIPVVTSHNVTDFAKFLFWNLNCIEISDRNISDASEYIVNQLIKFDIRNYQ